MRQLFYKLPEAAIFLERPEHCVIDLAEQELLPICFKADDELFGVTILNPDGSTEQVALFVPVNGYVKSLLPLGAFRAADKSTLVAVSVQVIQVGPIQKRHISGAKLVADNGQLPTTDDTIRFIKQGYTVTGSVDFIEVNSVDWRFHIDDLLALIALEFSKQHEIIEPTNPAPRPELADLDFPESATKTATAKGEPDSMVAVPPAVDDWRAAAVKLAQQIGERLWPGQRQITARGIGEQVAAELSKTREFWGERGPRDARSISSDALKGWKFTPPEVAQTGTSGTSGMK